MDKQEWQNLNSGVRVMEFGEGKLVCSFGKYFGQPCVFIQPVVGALGVVGEKLEEGREPQIDKDSVSSGSVVLVFHNQSGLDVLLNDNNTAIDAPCTVE